MGLQWYVAKTKPRAEHTLTEFLARWQVETYAPKIVRPHSSRRTMEYLFPSYVFCLLDPESRVWPIARWATGMGYFLGDAAGPTSVPEALIVRIRQLVRGWNEGSYLAAFQKGEQVTIASGPLAHLEAVFQRYLPAKERCQVLVELVGRRILVEVPKHQLEARLGYFPEQA